jgi:hypothetical protein
VGLLTIGVLSLCPAVLFQQNLAEERSGTKKVVQRIQFTSEKSEFKA